LVLLECYFQLTKFMELDMLLLESSKAKDHSDHQMMINSLLLNHIELSKNNKQNSEPKFWREMSSLHMISSNQELSSSSFCQSLQLCLVNAVCGPNGDKNLNAHTEFPKNPWF
jgi:hypothetical protein